MSKKDNTHKGHRERIRERFTENSDGFSDHELLEMILFESLPRVNTNPIAHRLIDTFGSLSKVFSASVSELVAVQGVGKRTAVQLNLLGKVISRVKDIEIKEVRYNTFETTRDYIWENFRETNTEEVLFLLLDKNYKKLAVIKQENKSRFNASMDVTDVAKAFSIYKPKHVVLAHNHPSGIAEPSVSDDIATMKINLLCMAHGANLADHIIFGKDQAFSYQSSAKLDSVKAKSDLNKILNSL